MRILSAFFAFIVLVAAVRHAEAAAVPSDLAQPLAFTSQQLTAREARAESTQKILAAESAPINLNGFDMRKLNSNFTLAAGNKFVIQAGTAYVINTAGQVRKIVIQNGKVTYQTVSKDTIKANPDNVYIQSTGDSVKAITFVYGTGNDVTLQSEGNVTITGKFRMDSASDMKLTVTSAAGSVFINGDLTNLSGKLNVETTANEGTVTLNGSVYTKGGSFKSLSRFFTNPTGVVSSLNGNISINASEKIDLFSALRTTAKAELTAGYGVDVRMALDGGFDLSITTGYGHVIFYKDLGTSQALRSVTVKSGDCYPNYAIVLRKVVTTGNQFYDSSVYHGIETRGDLISQNGNIHLKAYSGVGILRTAGVIRADNGTVTLEEVDF